MKSGRRRFATAAAGALVAIVMLSRFVPVASAAVMDADYVGNVQVGTDAALQAAAPNVSFPNGILTTMDGRVLWARDPDARVAMASTTKIMAAVVALERLSLDATVTVDKTAAAVGQSSAGLVVGETFTMGELLKGVLIESGNDAATLVAERVGGTVPDFVTMMNAKSAALGLTNTHYMNPHGLDQAGHYTSARDLMALARYAMRIPTFRSIVGVYSVRMRSNLYTHVLLNHNDLLKSYAGAEGVKTGWTNNAGYCVVLAVKRGPVELIGAVMGTANVIDRARQAKILFDWGFAHYRPVEVTSAGRSFGRVPVSDYMDRAIAAVSAETTSIPVFDLAGPVRYRADMLPGVAAPVTVGEKVGTLTVFQGSTILAQYPLVADRDVPAPTFWQSVTFFFGRIWRGIFGR
jgi:D-alanyl-D-alanine carboxypeptidase (penicillin-binding protein 5/6)